MVTVFPAGGRKVSWLDDVETKLAETEGTENTKESEESEEKIGVDAISMEELKRLAQLSELPEADIDVEEAVPAGPEDEVVPPEAEEQISDEEVTEEPPSEGEPIDEAAVAVGEAQEALGDAAEALADAGAVVPGEEEEAEIPISLDEETGDIAIEELEVEPEGIVAVEIEGEGLIPERSKCAPKVEASSEKECECEEKCDKCDDCEKPGCLCKCKEETKEATTVVAVDSSKFVKVAELSPANKKKLANYWITSLGYDRDYVKLMLKEYS